MKKVVIVAIAFAIGISVSAQESGSFAFDLGPGLWYEPLFADGPDESFTEDLRVGMTALARWSVIEPLEIGALANFMFTPFFDKEGIPVFMGLDLSLAVMLRFDAFSVALYGGGHFLTSFILVGESESHEFLLLPVVGLRLGWSGIWLDAAICFLPDDDFSLFRVGVGYAWTL